MKFFKPGSKLLIWFRLSYNAYFNLVTKSLKWHSKKFELQKELDQIESWDVENALFVEKTIEVVMIGKLK